MAVEQQYYVRRSVKDETPNSSEAESSTGMSSTVTQTVVTTFTNNVSSLPVSEDAPVTHPSIEKKLLHEIADKTHRKLLS